MSDAVDIDDAVVLLNAYAPSVLGELRSSYPELADQLDVGGIAGDADARIVRLAEVALRTLETVITELAPRGIANAEGRLKLQARLRLGGSLLATAASATVVGMLAADYTAVGLGSGLVAFAGSIVGLFAEHIGRIAKPGTSLTEVYTRLVTAKADAVLLESELSVWARSNPADTDEKTLKRLTAKATALFRDVNEALGDLGIASG